MSRPKGSKNKKKEVEAKKTPEPKPVVKIVDKVVDNVPRGICECTHVKEVHYGGEKGHCNTMNCRCSEFR